MATGFICRKCNTFTPAEFLDDIVECKDCGELIGKEDSNFVELPDNIEEIAKGPDDLLSTEERKEHDKAVLEDIVDRHGIDGVASMLRDVCRQKVKHLRTDRRDEDSVKVMEQCAEELDSFVGWYYGLGD